MTNSPTSSSSIHQNVVPSEVGWQFVPQYYTFVNKYPNRLHCFYTKQSTFTHGTEGEDTKTCNGQQEIHQKISSIGFQDCKVFIHSVDAQSSANGGIIIQVIGELSNRGEPWRKFVQTFFLAEQPNGYFVLNDIFRFLKEETAEEEVGEGVEVELTANTAAAPETTPTPAQVAPVPEPVREPTPPPTPVVTVPAPAVEEAPTTDSTEPQAVTPEIQTPASIITVPETNGISAPESEKSSPVLVEKPLTPVPVSPQQPQQQQQAPIVIPVLSAPQPPASVPTVPPTATNNTSAPHPPQSQAPGPAAAPRSWASLAAPRSWASLAASNSKKWGPTVAAESRGTTEVPVSASPGPSSGTQTPQTGGQPPAGGRPQQSSQGRPDHHSSYVAPQSITTPQCFVKGVTDHVSNTMLTTALTRFGPLKEIDVIRARMCAFIEYQNVDSARRAIATSLPTSQGGEGGLFIDIGGDAPQVRIFVETKKERGDRPPTRGRGGPPAMNGEGRGPPGGPGGHGGQGGQGGHGHGGAGGQGYPRRNVGRGRGSVPK